jgi:hypothetical protein
MRSLFLVVLVAGSIGCVGPSDPTELGQSTSAIGEPMSGFPSAAERLGLMAINRARSDPATVKGAASTIYPARPPVIWTYQLARSARFHANSLQLSDVTLMHTSPCTLNTDVATANCSGDPSCACATAVPAMCATCAKVDAVNTCGTDTFTRIGYFTAGSSVKSTGEVAAAGYGDPFAVVDAWMDEPAGSDGHRTNLTDQGITSNTMGYGHAQGAGCFSTFDVSDSGNLSGAQIPKLPTAATRGPTGGAAGSYTFYATWADPALGAPASLNVVIDGSCVAMARELGTDTLNATYKATVTLAAGCHNYFVAGTDAAGTALTYPTTGAVTIPVGSATACASDFLTTAPAASCAGDGGVVAPVDSGVSGMGGATGIGGAKGSGGASGTGSGGAKGSGGAPGAGSGGVSGTGSGGVSGAGSGGAKGSGGVTGTGVGGASGVGSGGATGAGGVTGIGGVMGIGGAKGSGGASGLDAGAGPKDAATGGCGCALGSNARPSASAGFLALALLALSRRRSRR